MSARIQAMFDASKKANKTAFVGFITAGFPRMEDTLPILQGFQRGGVDLIELGIPHSDPIGEGPTIQHATDIALKNGVTTARCLQFVKEARAAGITVPIVLMGYYNPVAAYGEEKIVKDAKECGADGFIVVDLPPEESTTFRGLCKASGLSLIQLVAMTTTNERLKLINEIADGFVYCISVLGVTGARKELPPELGAYIKRVRSHVHKPLAIGFGISTPAMFQQVAGLGDGVVVGSEIVRQMEAAEPSKRGEAAEKLARSFVEAGANPTPNAFPAEEHAHKESSEEGHRLPARFGQFGGRYAPETLIDALDELEIAYAKLKSDPGFKAELDSYASYVGRPTPLYFADRLTKECGGAQIWLKREDLAHTGAHKINNALGQALVAKRLGKTRIIAETGAGQHGVATATICAKLNLECIIYMGSVDIERQALNVFRMKMLGAKVVPVESGSKTLKDAVNEAMRDWVANIRTTHYIVGSAIGPHPFPTIVRDFQSVIGSEARAQSLEKFGKLPDYVVACVGGGSNAIGSFFPFVQDTTVQLVGVEAAGHGIQGDKHCATIVKGQPGVLHGTRTMILQDADGQISETHSISAGLDYPGVGPEHAHLAYTKRATYVAVDDDQALKGLLRLSQTEGIIPALETSHAVYHTIELAKTLSKDKVIVMTVSGRGDKDMPSVAAHMGVQLK